MGAFTAAGLTWEFKPLYVIANNKRPSSSGGDVDES
jgi:hypothetical protein